MRFPACNSQLARWRTALTVIAAASALLVAVGLDSGATATAVTQNTSAHVSKKQVRRELRACLRRARERRRAAGRGKTARRHKAKAVATCRRIAKRASRHSTKTVKHVTPPAKSTPPASGETGASPDTTAMPTGNIPGWTQVFADDFDGTSLNLTKWYPYASSEPGGDPGNWLLPSHVAVSGGDLVISTYRDPLAAGMWTSGGVTSMAGLTQTYGKYLVRFRFPAGHGISHGLMLLPADGSWPPEIDFSEDNGEGRNIDTATLHYGASDSMEHVTVATDLTQWHTLGVEWTKGKLVYTLDGNEWGRMEGANVPSIPMVMDIQTQAWTCGVNEWEACPNASTPATVNLYVDWAVAYAPSG